MVSPFVVMVSADIDVFNSAVVYPLNETVVQSARVCSYNWAAHLCIIHDVQYGVNVRRKRRLATNNLYAWIYASRCINRSR